MARPHPPRRPYAPPSTRWFSVCMFAGFGALLAFWSGVTLWIVGNLEDARWAALTMGALVGVAACAWRLDTWTRARHARALCPLCQGMGRLGDDIPCWGCND